MGDGANSASSPHYFLQRRFLGINDLLIIFNTKRCRYHCHFCSLPEKSSRSAVSAQDIEAQFRQVLWEVKHSLALIQRVTLSNEGSVLDGSTFPNDALLAILGSLAEMRSVREAVLETRLEFLEGSSISGLRAAARDVRVSILTGFETLDETIRDRILVKHEKLAEFVAGLDQLANHQLDLIAYVLFKPDFGMSDTAAYKEAEASIDFLVEQCAKRQIGLTVRLNPMYAAHNSRWERRALTTSNYAPPRLSDVLDLARAKRQQGVRIYLGLSTEGLSSSATSFLSREDFTRQLMKEAVIFNEQAMGVP
jgi:radical SAM enzyme (TIGR01210 family)